MSLLYIKEHCMMDWWDTAEQLTLLAYVLRGGGGGGKDRLSQQWLQKVLSSVCSLLIELFQQKWC
jgi:hypothetical protein